VAFNRGQRTRVKLDVRNATNSHIVGTVYGLEAEEVLRLIEEKIGTNPVHAVAVEAARLVVEALEQRQSMAADDLARRVVALLPLNGEAGVLTPEHLSAEVRKRVIHRVNRELEQGLAPPEIGGRSPFDPSAEHATSMFICHGDGTDTCLGVAVDNSGLILCTGAVGRIREVVQVGTSETHLPNVAIGQGLLQIVRIDRATCGLVPAFRMSLMGDDLVVHTQDAGPVRVHVATIVLRITVVEASGEKIAIDYAIGASSAGVRPSSLAGGAALTLAGEIAGICVAGTSSLLVIQPWLGGEGFLLARRHDSRSSGAV
jgi:hypothetical protein